jgi:hypothetical protein
MSSTGPALDAEVLDRRWRLGKLLGSGAAADVYEGTDEASGAPVAVKVLRVGGEPEARRFDREVEALESLDHPHVVRVIAHGDCDGARRYLVTERVGGGSLAGRLQSGPLPEAEAAMIGRDIADALAHAHDAGVVHRDVKPANVLLAGEGRAKLADFGIVRLDGADTITTGGRALGTPAYVAPEQVRGEPVGPAADVFSLGLVVLEAVTGERTFDGQGLAAAMARLEERVEVPESVSPRLRAALVAMTEPEPDRRPTAATCALLLGEALEGATEAIPVAATATTAIPVPAPAGVSVPGRGRTGPTPWERAERAVRRHPQRTLAIALGVVLLLLAQWSARDGVLGSGIDVPATTSTTVAPTTTLAPTTTAPPPPSVVEDGGDGDDRGNGNGHGRGHRDD